MNNVTWLDQTRDSEPWTIKSVAVRERAVARAAERGLTVGEWLDWAIPAACALQDGKPPLVDTAALADLLREARAVAAAAGVPIPKEIAHHALALVNAQLRAARFGRQRRRSLLLPESC
jgi:hypothetical protein